MAVISSINKWQGYTVGASRPVLYVAGSLSKHRKIIHEVISPTPCHSRQEVDGACSSHTMGRSQCCKDRTECLNIHVQVLSGLNQLDLNYVLVHINTAALFEVAGQHTMEMLMSPQHRLPEVTTLSR